MAVYLCQPLPAAPPSGPAPFQSSAPGGTDCIPAGNGSHGKAPCTICGVSLLRVYGGDRGMWCVYVCVCVVSKGDFSLYGMVIVY